VAEIFPEFNPSMKKGVRQISSSDRLIRFWNSSLPADNNKQERIMTNLPNVQARYSPIPQACDILGFRRSKLYELAGAGAIRIVTVGGRSLVDMEAALAYMNTLQLASIAPNATLIAQ
jgi:hypothetical protein